MRVLLTAASFAPSYGGPAVSVAQLAHALSDAGAETSIWAPDGSASRAALPAASRVRRLHGDVAKIVGGSEPPDVIHDNGVWRPHNHRLAVLAARHGITRVVSTRGMLLPWAMRHRAWKKTIAWHTYQARDLALASLLHVSGEPEAEAVRRFAFGVPVRTIPNGVDLPHEWRGTPASARLPVPGDVRSALFLGRIYPVKGLPMLVDAWSRVRPAGWRLAIAGADERGHRREVERAVAAARLQNVVTFLGPLDATEKSAALRGADVLVLPSLSESFGMVVAEALAHGVPVLTTTATPWSVLAAQGFGWSVDPTVDGVAGGLRAILGCDPARLADMGRRARVWAAEHLAWPGIAAEFLTVYADALRRSRAT